VRSQAFKGISGKQIPSIIGKEREESSEDNLKPGSDGPYFKMHARKETFAASTPWEED
jgi:hypothetical protein